MSAFYSSLSLNCITSSLFIVKYIYSNSAAKKDFENSVNKVRAQKGLAFCKDGGESRPACWCSYKEWLLKCCVCVCVCLWLDQVKNVRRYSRLSCQWIRTLCGLRFVVVDFWTTLHILWRICIVVTFSTTMTFPQKFGMSSWSTGYTYTNPATLHDQWNQSIPYWLWGFRVCGLW